MLVPPIDYAKGPFERVETPDEAIERLTGIYDEATQALRGAVYAGSTPSSGWGEVIYDFRLGFSDQPPRVNVIVNGRAVREAYSAARRVGKVACRSS